ncbi:MAG: oligosaccharide flippase family protein [Clostridia bacterium]|nr:oligosaccharide flippase family protein [Clostridia bacterium]
MNTRKTTVYTTASIVTALSIAERGLGFLYRIVLSRLIGAEGLGIYQVALSLFGLFLTVATGGIPITVSRMISKSKAERRPNDEQSAVSAGVCLCLILSLPVCLVFGLFGKRFSFLFSDPRSLTVFRILLLGLCFSALYAVMRGSFWGNKQFLLPSILEIAEESVMVIAGVLLLQRVASPASGAERAALAVVISYLFSFSASFICFFVRGGRFSNPKPQLKPLFNATMPITSVRASGSLVNSAVAVLLPVMLMRAGFENGEALALFGVVSGMVLPVLFIPSTVIGSLSLVLVPELSEDFYKKNYERLRKNILRGIRFAFLVACVLIPLFYAVGEDLGRWAFSNAQAGELIVKSCPLLLPMSLTMISTSILNSTGFERQTLFFYFVGAAVLLLCVLFLPAYIGVSAYLVGMFFNFLSTALCNLIFLFKKYPFFEKGRGHVQGKAFLLPLLYILPISLVGRGASALLSKVFGQFLALAFSSMITLGITLALYLFTGLLKIKKKDFL